MINHRQLEHMVQVDTKRYLQVWNRMQTHFCCMAVRLTVHTFNLTTCSAQDLLQWHWKWGPGCTWWGQESSNVDIISSNCLGMLHEEKKTTNLVSFPLFLCDLKTPNKNQLSNGHSFHHSVPRSFCHGDAEHPQASCRFTATNSQTGQSPNLPPDSHKGWCRWWWPSHLWDTTTQPDTQQPQPLP